GYVSSHAEIVELLRQRSRPYLFSNAVAPAVVAGSLAALDLVAGSDDQRAALRRNTTLFRRRMADEGFDVLPGEHPIAPVMFGDGPRLGEAMARRFGRDGYTVGLIARDEERLVALAERLGADGITASWHTAHVAEPVDLRAAVDALVDDAGRVDVVLHNISAW